MDRLRDQLFSASALAEQERVPGAPRDERDMIAERPGDRAFADEAVRVGGAERRALLRGVRVLQRRQERGAANAHEEQTMFDLERSADEHQAVFHLDAVDENGPLAEVLHVNAAARRAQREL